MKKRLVVSLVALLMITVCLSIVLIWAYNHPKCSFLKATPQSDITKEESETFYFEQCRLAYQPRIRFINKVPKSFSEKLSQIEDVFTKEEQKIYQLYTFPANINVSVEVKDGKTVVLYSGTATKKSTNESEKIEDRYVFDFVLTKDIQNEQ